MTRVAFPAGGRLVVRAPATSANLGPGFDCLGVALDLWNEVVAVPSDTTVVRTGGGVPAPPLDRDLVLVAANTLCERFGAELPPLALTTLNRIPLGRGLGSSAAAIACGLLLANQLLDNCADPVTLLEVATDIEGHPDNVTPCLHGGFRAATRGAEGKVIHTRVPTPLVLTAAAFVPSAPLPTNLARATLPSEVPFGDALFNVARSSLLVAALASGDASLLREATRDRLHQPYRAHLFSVGPSLIEHALERGALGAFVSGAGPTILALCDSAERAGLVADEMVAAAYAQGVGGVSMVLSITDQGAHIVDAD